AGWSPRRGCGGDREAQRPSAVRAHHPAAQRAFAHCRAGHRDARGDRWTPLTGGFGRLSWCRNDLTTRPGAICGRPSRAWRPGRTVIGVVAAGAVLLIGGLTGHVTRADNPSCAVVKCVALTFDDGPGPYTDRLLQIFRDNDAKATFFLIGNKVAANPAGAKRIADAGMEIGNHTWEHPNMTTIPADAIPRPFSRT